MKDMIILDNSPIAFSFQPQNGIPCTSWFDNPHDKELHLLVPILKKLSKVDDVRDYIKQFVKGDKIMFNKANELLKKRGISEN